MAVPVDVVVSALVVVLVGVVVRRPWQRLVWVLVASSLLVAARRRCVFAGRSCDAIAAGLAVGPRGQSVTLSARGPSPLLAEGLAGSACRLWC